MAGAGGRPLRADAQRNRDRLLAVAVRAFSGDAPDVTLESIARDAGVGIGTLYRHFPTREALVEAAYRNELARLCDAAAGLLRAGPPDQATRAWMDRFIDYMTAKRGMADALRAARRTILRVTSRPAAEQHLRDLARLRRVRDRIDREYAQPLDVEALARGAHMSAGHLSRQFRLAYGESPYSYLMTRRIERAMALLRRGDLSVTEVCFAVGCSSLGTFSTRFTELAGMPPSTYRSQAARATAGMPPCVAKQVTRPVRNREAPVTGPQLA